MEGAKITDQLWDLVMKQRTLNGFGKRLAKIRKFRGITQTELGENVGLSQRMIAYYEKDDAQPPGTLLVDLANALGTTTDELLGRKPIKEKTRPKTARLLKRIRRIEELSPADQRAVLKFLEALVEKHEAEKHSKSSKVA